MIGGDGVKSTALVQYKPLVKCIDRDGNEYFSETSYQAMTMLRRNEEMIDFSFSGDCVRSAHIVRHRIAEPEEVMLAWKMQQLSFWQRKAVEASKIAFLTHWGYSKPLTESLIDAMIKNAKAGKTPWQPTCNGA